MKPTKQLALQIAAALFVMIVAPAHAGAFTVDCTWPHNTMKILWTPDDKSDLSSMFGHAKLIDGKGHVFHGGYTATVDSMTVHQENGTEWFIKPYNNQWFHSAVKWRGQWWSIRCS
jgi:hypothetical protein